MDQNSLYQSCLKMLNDKYKINNYPKEKFMEIYSSIYKSYGVAISPNNDINKQVLIEIKSKIENDLKNDLKNDFKEEDIELKIKEFEAKRSSILKMAPLISAAIPTIEGDNQSIGIINQQQPPIQISNYNQLSNNPKFKTFMINTTKNNFKINSIIDIKYHSIYPSSILIPNDIKNKTPYLILIINDGNKQSNYTYISTSSNNSPWDIWNPIIDNYLDINLNNNNWTISIIDYFNNPIDFNEYQVIVNDVLIVNNHYTLNIDKPHYFSINDRIKILKNNGTYTDNIITNINNNIITINKNDLELQDFINSRIINYKHNITFIFKYQLKQQE